MFQCPPAVVPEPGGTGGWPGGRRDEGAGFFALRTFLVDPTRDREPFHAGAVRKHTPGVADQFFCTFDAKDIISVGGGVGVEHSSNEDKTTFVLQCDEIATSLQYSSGIK